MEPELNLLTKKFEEEKKRIISESESKVLKVKDDYESAIERIIQEKEDILKQKYKVTLDKEVKFI